MNILSIETSCDETGVAVLRCKGGIESPSFKVLSNQLLSQILAHREYGGVYPNLAKRLHGENLIPLLKETLKEASMLEESDSKKNYSQILQNIGIVLEREPELLKQFIEFIPKLNKPDIHAIAVTQGPGLEPALWVGINFAKALSIVWDIPVIPVNHMEGHIFSVLLDREDVTNPKHQTLNPKLEFPILSLLISGGHTELVISKSYGEYKLIGQTRDDAVGEAFDKVGRMLGLPYPGGPEISALAEKARNKQKTSNTKYQALKLPRPMINSRDYDFSFSGLKTAVLYMIRDKKLGQEEKENIAREFEDAVVEVLISKTKRAVKEFNPKTLIVAGGVVANNHLQKKLENIENIILRIPHSDITGDNAIMIGMAGYLKYKDCMAKEESYEITANGSLSLSSI